MNPIKKQVSVCFKKQLGRNKWWGEGSASLLRILGACMLSLLHKLKASVSSCKQLITEVENRFLLRVCMETWVCCACCPAEKGQGRGRCCRLWGIWKQRTSFRLLNCWGVRVCMGPGKPQVWLGSQRVSVDADAFLVLLKPLLSA